MKKNILVPLNQNVLMINIWGVKDKENIHTNLCLHIYGLIKKKGVCEKEKNQPNS